MHRSTDVHFASATSQVHTLMYSYQGIPHLDYLGLEKVCLQISWKVKHLSLYLEKGTY